MKIEKINETQIRCTLTSSDLESRKIRLSELAYGSDKAKRLFHDMMLQARNSFGFESGNSPLMIEAIPISPDSIVLIITKVDDPEELDTRFSRFSSPEPDGSTGSGRRLSGADEVLDLFRKLTDTGSGTDHQDAPLRRAGRAAEPSAPEEQEITAAVNLIQGYRFPSLSAVVRAARNLGDFYTGQNTLVRDAGGVCLLLHADGTSPEQFNKVCNILTEYGTSMVMTPGAEAHLLEQGDVLIRENALQTLAGF